MAVTLAGLALADAPEAWTALGFSLDADGAIGLGGVRISLGAPGRGIVAWSLRGLADAVEIDGLVTQAVDVPPGGPEPAGAPPHPNGAIGLDHVVVITPDFDRTAAVLQAHGLALRRVRHVGEGDDAFRRGFRRLGPAILELVESARAAAGPARFWGVTLIAEDLDAFVAGLGPERISEARAAVQPGRRIATLRRAAGLGMPVAVMDPEPPR